MPDPNVGQRVAANWEAVIGSKPEDQIHDDYWLLNRFSKGDGFKGLDGGDFIATPIEYDVNGTVGSYSDTDTISTTRGDFLDRYESEWKEYAGTYVCSELEKDRNSGAGQVFPLIPAKLENLKNSFRRTLNTDMFGLGTGNSGKVLSGLQFLVSTTPTTGTVQDVNRANFAFARNQQTTGTLTTTAFDNLRAAMRSNYNLCSNGIADAHPEFGCTTRTVFEGFEGLLIANERFADKTTGDGGFKNEVVKFKGMLLAYDNACPTGNMYLLNPKFLKLVYKTGAWMKARPAVNPANQTIDIVLIRTMCNLVAIQPRRLGVVSAIT
jgi:hypothetical protein